jgi:hypothetical protein
MSMTAQAEWLTTPPDKPGVYDFACEETGIDECVRVTRGEHGVLFCVLDGLNNTVTRWHDGLTNPRWRKTGELPKEISR